jgi:hypothetical protein
MKEHDDHGCGRVGRQTGLLCSGIGVAIAVLILKGMDPRGNLRLLDLGFATMIGVVALFVATAFFGTKAGVFLCKRGNRRGLNVAIGLALAFGSIAAGVWTGALAGLVTEVDHIPILFDFVLGMFSVLGLFLLFGGIPAIVLGVFYGLLVTWQLSQQGE